MIELGRPRLLDLFCGAGGAGEGYNRSGFNVTGVLFIKANNDRIQGKMEVHRRLKCDYVDGIPQPRLKVFKSCEHFWRTMPNMREDPKRPEDVEHEGIEDHPYECFRYGCMRRRVTTEKVAPAPPGSVAYIRERHKKARAYARRFGISEALAYDRIR